jgi:hypothetical protein
MTSKRTTVLVVFLISLVSLSSTSCGLATERIRTFEVDTDLCHYTFEYPDYYQTEGPSTDMGYERGPYTFMYLWGHREPIEIIVPEGNDHVKTVTSSYCTSSITISVYPPRTINGEFFHAKDYADSMAKGNHNWDYFELLERSTVLVSGTEAELVFCQSDWFGLFPASEQPKIEYEKAVFFDYDGLVWRIDANARMDINHRVMEDFENLLESFKILD